MHLSDIHFRWPKHGAKYELDDDLRNEVQRDSHRVLDQLQTGAPSAILITGDIAFSGGADEYKMASDWLLGDLYKVTKCPGEDVCCVPGNHDIDWNTIRQSKPIRDCHRSLRGQELHLLDGAIQEYLTDSFVFYRPLENYNKFAMQFNCDLSVSEPFWSRDFDLNDGSLLRVRGANSALISDEEDNLRTGKLLVLGSHQCTMKNEDGVSHVFLSHHPLQWLSDTEILEPLIRRAAVQLFGHKHEQTIHEIDDCLRVVAGAVHPERKERSWKPRYNWLAVAVEGEGDQRKLLVTVFPRVWSKDKTCFVPDYGACEGKDFRLYALPIDSWRRAVAPTVSAAGVSATPVPKPAAAVGNTQRTAMDPARTLAHRFLSLPYVGRMEVAQSLSLLRDEDEALPETERSKRIFVRARENRQLAQLWTAVEQRHADSKYLTNPFEQQGE
jgi:predicted phosphodiesterase